MTTHQYASFNFLLTVLSNVLSKIGDAVYNAKIVLPALLQSMGAPTYLIAWLVPMREALSMLPQVLLLPIMAKRQSHKLFWLTAAVLQGLCVLATGCIALYFADGAAMNLILLALAVFSVARSVASISSKTTLAKTLAKNERGNATGWATSIASLSGLLIGIFLYSDVVNAEASELLGKLLIISALIWIVAAGFYAQLKERDEDASEAKTEPSTALLVQLKHTLRDTVFVRF